MLRCSGTAGRLEHRPHGVTRRAAGAARRAWAADVTCVSPRGLLQWRTRPGFRAVQRRRHMPVHIPAHSSAHSPVHYTAVLHVVISGLLWFVLAACSRMPPEQALRRDVAALQAAIETRNADAVAAALDPAFIGPDGMDARAARGLAALQFMGHREVAVRLGPLQVQMQGAQAEVGTTAVMTGGQGGWLPDRAQAWQLASVWRREGEHWRLLRLDWQPALAPAAPPAALD